MAQFRSIICITSLCLLPMDAWASDPAPLFVVFVAIPSIIVSLAILVLCYALPRLGIFSACVALLINLLIAAWAGEVGYLNNDGAFFLSSLFMNVAGIVLAINKLQVHRASTNSQIASNNHQSVSIEAKDYVTVSEFADSKNLDPEKVIAMIKGGFYIGRYIDGKWYIHRQEH